MLRIHVLDALETALDPVAGAGEEGPGLEEVDPCAAAAGIGEEGVVVAEELGDEVDAVFGEGGGGGEELHERGGVVVGGLGVAQGVDGYEAEFVDGGDGGIADECLELL